MNQGRRDEQGSLRTRVDHGGVSFWKVGMVMNFNWTMETGNYHHAGETNGFTGDVEHYTNDDLGIMYASSVYKQHDNGGWSTIFYAEFSDLDEAKSYVEQKIKKEVM